MFIDTEETTQFTSVILQTEPPEERTLMTVANDYIVTESIHGYVLYYRHEPVGYFQHLSDLFDHIAEILNA